MKKILVLLSVTSLAISSATSIMAFWKKAQTIKVLPIASLPNDDNLDNLPDDSPDGFDRITTNKISVITIDQILPYINNNVLANDVIVKLSETMLKNLKNTNPEILPYLSYLSSAVILPTITQELTQDWYQQVDFGDSPLAAMKNFINSSNGDIAQAKNAGSKGQWHYVEVRAKNWTWNDFYEYMAGANFNYMIKILTGGKYIGDLIDEHLHLGPFHWGFDQQDFINDLTAAFKNLPANPIAIIYLLHTIVPLIKIKLLNLSNPTLGFKNLTWEKEQDQDLSLKDILTRLHYLLSPDGYDDLVSLLGNFLFGPFGEDIIVNLGMAGYYTFSEMLEYANSWPIKYLINNQATSQKIGAAIADVLIQKTDSINLPSILDNIISTAQQGITTNPVVDFREFNSDITTMFSSLDTISGIMQFQDLLTNPDSTNNLATIFKAWGVQPDQHKFKENSLFFILKKWIDDPNSFLNQVLNILRNIELRPHS